MNDKQPLVELIYFSSSIANLTQADFEFLLKGAQEKNQQQNISGVIYYSNGFFLQLIEGPRQNINRLFQSICHDARHFDISLVSFRTIEQKHFEQWSMQYRTEDIDDLLTQQNLDTIDLAHCLRLFKGEVG